MTQYSDYSTKKIYNTLPEFIQESDAINGQLLYKFLQGVATFIDTINAYSRDSVGASGGVDNSTYTWVNTDPAQKYPSKGAPGWSQVLDINRAQTTVLPWLGQFVGVRINPSENISKTALTKKIKNHSSFQRGTRDALVSALVAAVNAASVIDIDSRQVIVLEQTKYTSSGYAHDDYSMIILLPSVAFNIFTYQQIENLLNTTDGAGNITYYEEYTDIETYVKALTAAQSYDGLKPNTTPVTTSKVASYINNFRPAGIQIYIGGY